MLPLNMTSNVSTPRANAGRNWHEARGTILLKNTIEMKATRTKVVYFCLPFASSTLLSVAEEVVMFVV